MTARSHARRFEPDRFALPTPSTRWASATDSSPRRRSCSPPRPAARWSCGRIRACCCSSRAARWSIYGLDRLRDVARDGARSPLRTAWVERHRRALVAMTALAALGALVAGWLCGARVVAVAAGVAALGLAHRRIKHWTFGKPLYLILSWTAVPVALPLARDPSGRHVGWVAGVVLFSMWSNVILSNLKDREARRRVLRPASRAPRGALLEPRRHGARARRTRVRSAAGADSSRDVRRGGRASGRASAMPCGSWTARWPLVGSARSCSRARPRSSALDDHRRAVAEEALVRADAGARALRPGARRPGRGAAR